MTAMPGGGLSLAAGPSWGRQFEHATLRTVILPRREIVYVPIPKAGCTSLLWMLAEIAGYQDEHFHRSTGRAVNQEMTIHDIHSWRRQHRWKDVDPQVRRHVADGDGWLRFTTVRDPASRVWSAWQSKLLLREAVISDKFADRPWFPRIPQGPDDVLEDFSSFVKALKPPATRPVDVHWAPQTDILQTAAPLNFIGRVEKMSDVVAVLRERLGPVVDRLKPRRENSSLLRYDPAIFDEEGVAVVNELYARDFEELGYPPLEFSRTSLAAWRAETQSLLHAVAGYISRHQRVARLNRIVGQRSSQHPGRGAEHGRRGADRSRTGDAGHG